MKVGDVVTFPDGTLLFSRIYNEEFPVDANFPLYIQHIDSDGCLYGNDAKVEVSPETAKLAIVQEVKK